MIVVVGTLVHRPSSDGAGDEVAGRAGAIARAAAAAGAAVQIVGKIGDDGAGDALIVALGRAGVGHAALLRDPAHPTPIAVPRSAAAGAADEADDLLAEDGSGPGADAILPADPLLRPTLEIDDLELALRYLPGIGTIVVAEPVDAALARAVAGAAAYSSARLIGIVEHGASATVRAAYGDDATLLAAPVTDRGEGFARLVGGYAARLDGGEDPATAFRAALSGAGWEHAEQA